jgi:hypothetical protein
MFFTITSGVEVVELSAYLFGSTDTGIEFSLTVSVALPYKLCFSPAKGSSKVYVVVLELTDAPVFEVILPVGFVALGGYFASLLETASGLSSSSVTISPPESPV